MIGASFDQINQLVRLVAEANPLIRYPSATHAMLKPHSDALKISRQMMPALYLVGSRASAPARPKLRLVWDRDNESGFSAAPAPE